MVGHTQQNGRWKIRYNAEIGQKIESLNNYYKLKTLK